MLDPHKRFRSDIAGHLAEVLSAEEAAWMAAHATECEACRDVLGRVRARLPELGVAGGHPPATLLSAWLRGTEPFTPLEAKLLEQHLAHCDECRAELDEMARFTGIVPGGATAARERRLRRGYGAAGLLVAAVLIAVVATNLQRRAPVAPDSTWRQGTLAPPPTPAGLAPAPLLVFADRMRGADEGVPVVDTLRAPARRLRVRLPLLFLGAAPSALVTVAREDGTPVADLLVAREALGRELELVPADGAWTAGNYELRVIPGGGRDTSATRRYRFVLVNAGG